MASKIPFKKLHIYALIAGVFAVSVMLMATLSNKYPSTITINEVSFTANSGNDWIELYNPSLNSVSLKGYYISDNAKNLTKFEFTEDVLLPRHGYLVLYGGKHNEVPEGGMRISFNIANGETLYLVAQDGSTIIDRLTVLGESGESVGRFPDGSSDTFTFSNSTQGARNDKDEIGNINQMPR
jgi:hypothetical protein